MTKNFKLLDIIKESERDMFEGFVESELTEDYPVGFDLSEFKKIWSYAGKLRYAREHLGKPIGSGSARTVYRVDETKVLKLAKNKKGVAQNDAETDWTNDAYYGEIIAKVHDFDEHDHLWVEMELAFKAKKSDFKTMWGVDFMNLGFYITNFYNLNHSKRPMFGIDDDVKDVLDESHEVQLLCSFVLDSSAPPGDIRRISSWGKVKREDGEYLVLIDFGLNKSVYTSYYS